MIKNILNEELSSNLKTKHNYPKVYTQLCITKGNLDVLIKMVKEYDKENGIWFN